LVMQITLLMHKEVFEMQILQVLVCKQVLV
jgi:hypothetical protein